MGFLVIFAGIGILVALGLYLYGNSSSKKSEGISFADGVATAKPKTEVNSTDAPADPNVVSARTAVSETPTALQITPSWIAQTQQTTGNVNPVATEMTAEQQKEADEKLAKELAPFDKSKDKIDSKKKHKHHHKHRHSKKKSKSGKKSRKQEGNDGSNNAKLQNSTASAASAASWNP
ncbi:hypothetical protein M3Y98_00637100 [Aphelenchoides besseyi]|nr:hypothetical protein M3Y98_00637100 [Aphelenchoides besseyi]